MLSAKLTDCLRIRFILSLACACAFGCGGGSGADSPVDAEADAIAFPPCSVDNIEFALFERYCNDGTCHDSEDPADNLDLQSPGAAERMIDAMSFVPACSDKILVVAGDPGASLAP